MVVLYVLNSYPETWWNEMEATEYMYSGLPIASVGRLSNHPDVETCSDISK